ncbi:MAG TPA: Clp protease N-terminal domain-containing protein [Actinomycetales bacterium]|nr:Clp protease N-terminal domain-containing protein [Actinomycetales bacterium]
MFERFTKRARVIVVLAQEVARDAGAQRITPAHLLASLIQDEGSRAVQVLCDLGASPDRLSEVLGRRRPTMAGLDESEVEALRSIGIDAAEVVRRVEAELGAPLRDAGRWTSGHIPFDKGAKKVLELSLREAIALGAKEIGSEHVLLGLVRDAEGPVAEAFSDAGITLGAARAAVAEATRRAG